jgi:hypothetical protein
MGTNKNKPLIVFLLYMNRSGSTFLSYLLDQYQEIGVTPEANIPDGLLIPGAEIKNRADFNKYLDRLYMDNKFADWNVDRTKLEQALQAIPMPFGFGQILPAILNVYFQETMPRVYMYKRGHYITHVASLRRLFPGCRFIYIERDIRGIFESQKRSVDSVTGRVMARNSVERAIKYVRTMGLVEKFSKDRDFFVIAFEKLISAPEEVIMEILDFLSVEDKHKMVSNYYQKIPANQRHLHKMVLKRPTHHKIDEWKETLSNAEIMAIQRVAGGTLERRGYELSNSKDNTVKNELFFLRSLTDLIFRHSVVDGMRKIMKSRWYPCL